MYFRKVQEGSFIYLLLYVDNILIASKSKDETEKLKSQLNQEFEMKDLSKVKKIFAWRYTEIELMTKSAFFKSNI